MIKRFDKKENLGITLIALVITIVVLIILAGVIISITLGNGGIIDRAKTAKQEYANAQGKEEKEIAEYGNKIDEYSAFTRAGESNIDYTEGEQDTGLKWIDGKSIYQKVLTGNTSGSSGLSIVGLSIGSRVDKYIDCRGILIEATGRYQVIPLLGGGSNEYATQIGAMTSDDWGGNSNYPNKNTVYVTTHNEYNEDFYLVVQYTKK